eukprot:gene7870-9978_t
MQTPPAAWTMQRNSISLHSSAGHDLYRNDRALEPCSECDCLLSQSKVDASSTEKPDFIVADSKGNACILLVGSESCPASTRTSCIPQAENKPLSPLSSNQPTSNFTSCPAVQISIDNIISKHEVEPIVVSRPATTPSHHCHTSALQLNTPKPAAQLLTTCDACPYCDDVCGSTSCRFCQLKAARANDRAMKRRDRDCKKTVFTMCQVRRHNTEGDCWLVAHRKVYDVTPFVANEFHRAGMQSIIRKAGKDVSRDFDFHSGRAKKQLWSKYMIGVVAKQLHQMEEIRISACRSNEEHLRLAATPVTGYVDGIN